MYEEEILFDQNTDYRLNLIRNANYDVQLLQDRKKGGWGSCKNA